MCCSDSRVWSCAQAGLNISSDVNVQWLWINPSCGICTNSFIRFIPLSFLKKNLNPRLVSVLF